MATANSTQPAAAGSASAEGKKDKVTRVKGLRVVGRSEGFRRAGRAFGAEPVEIALSDLSKEQIKALRDERQLVVTDIEIDLPAQDE
ncbi:HI1506-related protein [Variovorax gossypii]